MLVIALFITFVGLLFIFLMGRSLLYWKNFSFHTPHSIRKKQNAYLSGAVGILLLIIGLFWLF